MRRRLSSRSVAICLVALVGGVLLWRVLPDDRGPHDVLIVTLDTARADRFSYAGGSRVETPSTDMIAREGIAFLEAVAPAPITLVSHASLFTGLNPPNHGVRNNGTFALSEGAVTLAESLRELGFATAAFVGAAVLDRRYGLDQGFDTYDDRMPTMRFRGWGTDQRRGDEVVAAALEWLHGRAADERTFAWVHLFDPHEPYDPPEPERSRYEHPYDAEVAYSDRLVGELVEGYRRAGRYDETLVVVTSDHGESLGEHGEATHGVFVYDSTVRIPLVMKGPGLPERARVTAQVRLVDVLPTVLALLGAPLPEDLDGRSLLEVVADPASAPPDAGIAYLESFYSYFNRGWAPLRGLRTARYKYVEGVEPELYALPGDAREARDLAGEAPDLCASFRESLDRLDPTGGSIPGMTLAMDRDTEDQLASLGYVWIDPDVQNPENRELLDPRAQIAFDHLLQKALRHMAKGQYEEALEPLEDLLQQSRQGAAVLSRLAMVQSRTGRHEEALATHRQIAELAPFSAASHLNVGVAAEKAGLPEEALAAYARALELEPRHPGARSSRWRLMEELGRTRELALELEALVDADPGDGQAVERLLRLRTRELPRSDRIAALERVRSESPEMHEVTAALALELFREGDLDRAEELFSEVLRHDATHYTAALVVGSRMLARNEVERALSILERAARANREQVPLLRLLARARWRSGDSKSAMETIQDALRIAPGDADLYALWGEVLAGQGRHREAATAQRKARSLRSGSPRQDPPP